MDGMVTPGIVATVIMLVVVLGSIIARRPPAGQVLRHVAGWIAVFAVVYGVMLFRNDIAALWARARADISGEPIASADGSAITLAMEDDGHFWASGSTEAGSIRFLVDSGATTTILSASAARTLGVTVDDGFPVMVDTANGRIMTRRAEIGRLMVGSIGTGNLPVLVSDADDINVLGMNWLSRMESWQVRGRVMEIRPRQ